MNKSISNIRHEIARLVSEHVAQEAQKKIFIPGETFIPASAKMIDADEINNMVQAALDGWLTAGRFNDMFEKKLSQFLGIKYLITVNSGSSANLIAVSSLTSHKLGDRAIRPGDEVVTVAAGFPTTVNPILQIGAVPVFVDVDLETYNVNVDQLENAIGPRTKAIVLAHTLGNPFNLDAVTALCRKNNLWLVEDCCDALGSRYKDKLVGTFGDIGTLSFYPAHHITMGEGGAVFTNNGKLKKIAESFRDWGRDCYCPPGKDNTCKNRFSWGSKKLGGSLPDGYDHKYTYSHTGYNFKITDMQAACGVAQLDKLKYFIKQRRANFSYLKAQMKSLEDFVLLPSATTFSDPSWFGFPITLKTNHTRNSRSDLVSFLEKNRIGTRLLFGGNLIRQPYFENKKFRVAGNLSNTEKIMNDTFWVGIHPSIDRVTIEYIADKIGAYFSSKVR